MIIVEISFETFNLFVDIWVREVHPLNASSGFCWIADGRITVSSFVQSLNADLPIDCNDEGIIDSLICEHPENAKYPIDFDLVDNLTSDKSEQFKNVSFSIWSSIKINLISFNFLHLLKTPFSIWFN